MDSSWVLYSILAILRICCCFSRGYIHPDEFFQGGQELFYGSVIPWEFEPDNAIRSIVPPLFMTRLPMSIYVTIFGKEVGGWEVFIVPRLFMCLLSFLAFDFMMWTVSSVGATSITPEHQRRSKVPTEVLVLASSWPLLIFGCRPFTNTLESMVLSCLMTLVILTGPSSAATGCRFDILAGVLCSVGFFTRFTFVFYAFPVIVSMLTSRWRDKGNFDDSSAYSSVISCLMNLAVGFLLCSFGFMLADTYYYMNETGESLSSLTDVVNTMSSKIAPLNALIYNSNLNNLSDHGLHSRVTHSLVNMPMLFGTLAVSFYIGVGSSLSNPNFSLCRQSIVFGLAFLSSAPHQEPRFLLPIIFPVILIHARSITSKRFLVYFWAVFNLCLLIFFSALHQAGVVPSVLGNRNFLTNQGSELSLSPTPLIYYHTYMPPTFLSVIRSSNESSILNYIIDLKGSSQEKLTVVLEEHFLQCSKHKRQRKHQTVNIVTQPYLLSKEWIYRNDFDLIQLSSYWPHLSTENFPPFTGDLLSFVASMELVQYEVLCSSLLK